MNKGVELDLNGIILRGKDYEWAMNFNLTHYTNKITALDPDLEKNGGQKGSYYIYRVGGSLYQSYLKTYAGVDPDTGKALYYVDPDNGDYTKTSNYEEAQQADQGTTLPKVYGGLGTQCDSTVLISHCSFLISWAANITTGLIRHICTMEIVVCKVQTGLRTSVKRGHRTIVILTYLV